MARRLSRWLIVVLIVAFAWGWPLYFHGEMLAATLYWTYVGRGMERMAVGDVIFYFEPGLAVCRRDEAIADLERYRQQLDYSLGPVSKPPLIILTTPEWLDSKLSGGYSLGAAGAYQPGVALVALEPAQTVARSSLLHELTHHYVHLLSGGNYPEWYSEGVAQLMEYRYLGYRWFDAVGKKDYYMYSATQLNQEFYRLPDQVSAYRQALGLVQLMEQLGGGSTHGKILRDLGRGADFSLSVECHTGLNPEQIVALWKNTN